MACQPFSEVEILEMMVGRIRRNEGPVAELVVDTPHIEFGWQSFYFHISTIQSVGNHGRIYLISILVISVFIHSLATIVELCMDVCEAYYG